MTSSVINYAKLHQDEPKDIKRSSIDDFTPEDLALFNIDKKAVFEVILAANYLDFPGLLELGCKYIANDLKNKTIEEVERDYHIPPEHRYTEEEKEKIEQVILILKKEMRWVNGE